MSELYEIRISRILAGPDSFFVAATHPGRDTEFHFIVQNSGPVHGRISRHKRWVELSAPTNQLIREKVRRYFSESVA